ncbi:hypothetical protein Droror1_Dr00018875 [Drosera rotundifolia]
MRVAPRPWNFLFCYFAATNLVNMLRSCLEYDRFVVLCDSLPWWLILAWRILFVCCKFFMREDDKNQCLGLLATEFFKMASSWDCQCWASTVYNFGGLLEWI